MTDHRQQAIRDVAAAMRLDPDIVKTRCQISAPRNWERYCVAQRERVLELEAQLSLLPADWRTDSSLETWFPFTAEDLEKKTRLQQNLVLLVRRLCHRVRTLTTIVGKNNASAVAGDQLAKDAERFLENHGLNGSILRADPEAQLQQKEGERG